MRAQTKLLQARDAEVENIYLKNRNELLMNEVSTVQWYINVFEDGKDTKEIVKLYG